MILPVFLRILILFAIVLVFIQTMIDLSSLNTEAEDQNISIHARHPALWQSKKMSSGTALQRFPYDSINNRGDDNLASKFFREPSIRQEPVPALAHACTTPPHDDPSFETMVVDGKRGGEGKVYSPAGHGSVFPFVPASPRRSSRDGRGGNFPPAEYELELTALTAIASCLSKSASTSWILDVSSLSMTREKSRGTTSPADHGRPWASANTGAADHGSKISAKIPLCLMRVCDALHNKRGAEGRNLFPGTLTVPGRNYFLSKPTTGRTSMMYAP